MKIKTGNTPVHTLKPRDSVAHAGRCLSAIASTSYRRSRSVTTPAKAPSTTARTPGRHERCGRSTHPAKEFAHLLNRVARSQAARASIDRQGRLSHLFRQSPNRPSLRIRPRLQFRIPLYREPVKTGAHHSDNVETPGGCGLGYRRRSGGTVTTLALTMAYPAGPTSDLARFQIPAILRAYAATDLKSYSRYACSFSASKPPSACTARTSW